MTAMNGRFPMTGWTQFLVCGLFSGCVFGTAMGMQPEGPGPEPCNDADLAEPFGVLDFTDVLAFLTAFGDKDSAADLAEPTGVFDFTDVLAFLTAYGDECYYGYGALPEAGRYFYRPDGFAETVPAPAVLIAMILPIAVRIKSGIRRDHAE